MKGTAVRRIQEALAALYFYPYKEAKNNDIEMAAAGRKRRTRSNGSSLMYELSADGIYGPKTKAKLESLLK
ncbi:N-acetylmuramoyl-L-alanine amidase [Bacillus paralicheniformis]|nr:N-acetylmuramoyl-L-alanine amidase [Bacillus paralicheniformis]